MIKSSEPSNEPKLPDEPSSYITERQTQNAPERYGQEQTYLDYAVNTDKLGSKVDGSPDSDDDNVSSIAKSGDNDIDSADTDEEDMDLNELTMNMQIEECIKLNTKLTAIPCKEVIRDKRNSVNSSYKLVLVSLHEALCFI